MELFLSLISGIAWTIVYIEIIKLAIKHKFVGMPLFALALNFAWEGIYTFRGLTAPNIHLQTYINLVWFLLDGVMVYLYFKFTKNHILWSLLVFTCSLVLQLLFILEFQHTAPYYSAFLQNLLMSILFIQMYSIYGTIGQNMTIAVAKWLGTLAPTILMGLIGGRFFSLVVGILCSVFDLIYIYLLSQKPSKTISSQISAL